MNEQEAIDLMKSSRSTQEWNDNCDKIKAAYLGKPGASFDGYPDWWYARIIRSGVADMVRLGFKR